MKCSFSAAILVLAAIGIGAAHGAVVVLDDDDPGWSTTGAWTKEASVDTFNGDEWYQTTSNNGGTSTWAFSGLPADRYCISTSWRPDFNRTTAAQYTASDGIGAAGTINQTSWASQNMRSEVGGGDALGAGYARVSNFNGYIPYYIADGTLSITASHGVAGLLMADSIRLETVRPLVEKIWVIDSEEGAPGGYTESGTGWIAHGGDAGDHRLDFRYSGDVNAAATYAFTGLDDGSYRVSAAWTGHANRTAQAMFAIPGVGSITVNQEIASAGDLFEDVLWQDLFTNVNVTGGTLSVILSNAGSDGFIIADAVRLERMTPEPGTLSLLALGGLGLLRRRRRKAS